MIDIALYRSGVTQLWGVANALEAEDNKDVIINGRYVPSVSPATVAEND